MKPFAAAADMHVTVEPDTRRRCTREGSRVRQRGVLANRGERGSLQAGRVRIVGVHMKTVVALLRDKAGVSSTKLALMIGLSSSAVLILVRVGVAVAGE